LIVALVAAVPPAQDPVPSSTVDQGQAIGPRRQVPVVVGTERERHFAAVRLEQLDVGNVEAEVLDLRRDAAAAQACDGRAAGDGRASGVRGEIERDGLRAVVSTAASAGAERCGSDSGEGEGLGDRGLGHGNLLFACIGGSV